MNDVAFMAPDRRPFIDRMWSRLGFGTAFADRADDDLAYAPGYISTGVKVHFDWRDRLRILISGRVHVDCVTKTDVPVKHAYTNSCTSVLPPNHDVRRP